MVIGLTDVFFLEMGDLFGIEADRPPVMEGGDVCREVVEVPPPCLTFLYKVLDPLFPPLHKGVLFTVCEAGHQNRVLGMGAAFSLAAKLIALTLSIFFRSSLVLWL